MHRSRSSGKPKRFTVLFSAGTRQERLEHAVSTAGTMMSTYTLIDISILCTFFTRVIFLDAILRSASRLRGERGIE